MLAYIVFVAMFHAISAAKPFYQVNDFGVVGRTFENFIREYNRSYEGHEKFERFEYFVEHLKLINKLNAEFNAIHDINNFADMSYNEKSLYSGRSRRISQLNTAESPAFGCNVQNEPQSRDAPAAWDWRDHGVVSPVKDQDSCSSCWAFATIALLESRYLMDGRQLSLSEQQLVDCVPNTDCVNGGRADLALATLISQGGVESEADYPYEVRNSQCRFDKSKVAATVSGCTIHSITNEDALKELVYKNGPVVVALAASHWRTYSGSIQDDCDDTVVDHEVLLVGYGTEGTEDYWIIKNSWSDHWGDKGFIKLRRGVNCCRIINNLNGITSVTI